jgi:hypothetical protein
MKRFAKVKFAWPILLLSGITLLAQSPAGSIAGVITDLTGAVMPEVRIVITHRETELRRTYITGPDGAYSAAALPVGNYEIRAEKEGFSALVRQALVEAGLNTTVDLSLRVGQVQESVAVLAALPQIQHESHQIGGVVTRTQIESLPLNGRSFYELAKLEPGVQPAARGSNNRTFVPILGAPGGNSGRGTRVTVDGGSVMAIGNGGAAMGLSQEAVQEFQVSTVNFDLITGVTSSGAVNVVTRSGGNEMHGSAFYFFRDHKIAAYPALVRDPVNPDPFFQRRQFGFGLGGPIQRDRVFFFANWERNEQRGVGSTLVLVPDFAHLSRITPSPLFGNQFSGRLDARLSNAHFGFLRYSHDGNRAVGPSSLFGNAPYPSNWTRQQAWADQTVLGLTSVGGQRLVNDFRLSYFFISSKEVAPEEQDCRGCLGIGAPVINIVQAGLQIGNSSALHNIGRRFHLNDSITWQRGAHRIRLGGDWEYHRGGLLQWLNEPATMILFSPDEVRRYNALPQTPTELRIPLPAAFRSLDDVLQLPLSTFTAGIGDPRVPQRNGGTTRSWNAYRLFLQDTWRMHARLTTNYGLGWTVDGYGNYDLSKPALLAPILGENGLGPRKKNWKNFSPLLGLAWTPSSDSKTVVRAGAGIFYDFFFGPIDGERVLLGSPGLGRQNVLGSSIPNPLANIPGVPVGRMLDFRGNPTRFTGAHLVSILPATRAGLAENLASNRNTPVTTVEVTKQVVGQLTGALYPHDLPNPSALHVNVGIQREVATNFVLSSDFAYRHFADLVAVGGVDLNRFNSVRGPIIPRCTSAQTNDPQARCSRGPINVVQGAGTATYKGILLRADKRFSNHFQLLGSYAYSSNTGTQPVDLDDRLGTRGPLDRDYTHITNVGGLVQMHRFELGFNFSYSSAPPFNAFVGGIDFNGDGTSNDALPGAGINQFNRGLDRADLARLVVQFNETYAGKRDALGSVIPRLTVPARYELGDDSHALDLRLSRRFAFRERWRLSIIGEVFNVYNSANLSGHSGNLTNTAFGQPTVRATQVFGSAGPRAFQVVAKVGF